MLRECREVGSIQKEFSVIFIFYISRGYVSRHVGRDPIASPAERMDDASEADADRPAVIT